MTAINQQALHAAMEAALPVRFEQKYPLNTVQLYRLKELHREEYEAAIKAYLEALEEFNEQLRCE